MGGESGQQHTEAARLGAGGLGAAARRRLTVQQGVGSVDQLHAHALQGLQKGERGGGGK